MIFTRQSGVLLVGLAITLSACERETETAPGSPLKTPEAQRTAFTAPGCDRGAVINLTFAEPDRLSLSHQNKTYQLSRHPTGQGTLYSGDGVEWRVVTQGAEEISTLRRLAQSGPEADLVVCRRPVVELGAVPEPGALKPCISPNLTYVVEAGDAGMGHRQTTISVKNTGPKPCQLLGYSRLELVDKTEQSIPGIQFEPQNEGYFGKARAAVPILLQVGDQAYFDIGWSVIPNEDKGEDSCPQGAAIRLAPPGDSGGKLVSMAVMACDRKLNISPYRTSVEP